MKTKKLTTELTDQELIAQLTNTNEVVGNQPKRQEHKFTKVLDFVSKYNIKSGNNEITSKILFELFKIDYPEVGLKSFVFQLKKLLPYKRPRHITIFLIDKNQLEITNAVKENFITPKATITRQRNMKRHVEGFMKYFKIKPGNNAINFKIIADLYDRWTYKFKKKKVSDQTLSTLLKLYLEFYIHSNNTDRYFKVHDDIFTVVTERQMRNILNAKSQ